jgi:hypothetical protein
VSLYPRLAPWVSTTLELPKLNSGCVQEKIRNEQHPALSSGLCIHTWNNASTTPPGLTHLMEPHVPL